jgi:hypothetical protein
MHGVERTEQSVLEKSATGTHLLNSTFGRTLDRTFEGSRAKLGRRTGWSSNFERRAFPEQGRAVILSAQWLLSEFEQ